MSPIQEAGKTARGFMDALKGEPLSLALCAMNLILLGYLFYEGSSVSAQRQAAIEQIVRWQAETNKLMADCVSKDVVKVVVDALERDRELYRRLLPQQPAPP
jgi:hypothetical protein